MDTSEKYIKMCERAQEIQEYYQNQHKVDVMLRDFVFVKCINFYDSVNTKYDKESGFWLPRQDQLQEICPIDLVMGILGNSWSDEMGFDKEDELLEKYLSSFKTNEQIHLAFIMKEKYNKIWNEEKQDWIQL